MLLIILEIYTNAIDKLVDKIQRLNRYTLVTENIEMNFGIRW